MIRVVCTCGRAFKAEDRHAGRQAKCPECGAALTIGPASGPGPTRSGSGDAPAWWHGKSPTGSAERATAPTRSGSDPGADAVGTTEPAAGAGHRPGPPASGPSPGADASVPAGSHRILIGGAAALLVVAMGAFLWLRPGTPTPDAGGVAPHHGGPRRASRPARAGTRRRRCRGERKIPPRNGSPGRRPSNAGTGASTSSTKGDAGGRAKADPAVASRGLRMLVPAYIYPLGDGRKEWQRLIDAASRVELVVIANPNSGPGEDRDVVYDAIFTEATTRGVTLVGYVSTDFGRRPPAEIKRDIETWVRLYPQIRGIFFDQQPRESRHAALFAELRGTVRQKLREPLVITNPGIPCDESYLAQDVSNVTCVFVNFQGFERFELPSTFKPYDASRFAAMPYNIPDAETMRGLVKEAVLKRIGYLYLRCQAAERVGHAARLLGGGGRGGGPLPVGAERSGSRRRPPRIRSGDGAPSYKGRPSVDLPRIRSGDYKGRPSVDLLSHPVGGRSPLLQGTAVGGPPVGAGSVRRSSSDRCPLRPAIGGPGSCSGPARRPPSAQYLGTNCERS